MASTAGILIPPSKPFLFLWLSIWAKWSHIISHWLATVREFLTIAYYYSLSISLLVVCSLFVSPNNRLLIIYVTVLLFFTLPNRLCSFTSLHIPPHNAWTRAFSPVWWFQSLFTLFLISDGFDLVWYLSTRWKISSTHISFHEHYANSLNSGDFGHTLAFAAVLQPNFPPVMRTACVPNRSALR